MPATLPFVIKDSASVWSPEWVGCSLTGDSLSAPPFRNPREPVRCNTRASPITWAVSHLQLKHVGMGSTLHCIHRTLLTCVGVSKFSPCLDLSTLPSVFTRGMCLSCHERLFGYSCHRNGNWHSVRVTNGTSPLWFHSVEEDFIRILSVAGQKGIKL